MNKLRKLILVGGAGTSRDVLALISLINRITPQYEVLGLLDDSLSIGSRHFGTTVLGGLTDGTDYKDVSFVDCLGSPRGYRDRQSLLEDNGLEKLHFETLIHPSVVLAEDVEIGQGCILYPNVVALANVRVGNHVTILSASVLNHDVEVGSWSIVASGVMLSGGVRVGEACYLGTASTVREGVSIGNGSMVGMGSVVTSDVGPNEVVAGVPAKFMRGAE